MSVQLTWISSDTVSNVPRERLPIVTAAWGKDNSCYIDPVDPLYLFSNGTYT